MRKNIRIKILDLGCMTFYKKELVQTKQEKEMIISPALAVLIEHPTLGYLLYDTGNDDAWEETYPDHIKETYPVTKLVTIADALQKEGLSVQDINYLILSHLHFDHAGGLKYFANTKAGSHVLVSKEELQDVLTLVSSAGQSSGAYIGSLFLDIAGVSFSPLSDKTALGQGITLFVQKCHTQGLIGMRICLQDRTVIFTGDTIYTAESYEKALPPGGSINKTNDEFFANLAKVKQMQEQYQAEVFFGHDYEQACAWQAQGWLI